MQNICRLCANARTRYHYQRNRETNKAYARRRHAERRTIANAARKQWTAENYARQRANIRAWNAQHPEKLRAYSNARRARKIDAPGAHGAEDVLRIYREQGGQCFYCGDPLNGDYEVEHKTPLCRGGSNAPENICCACAPCNRRKRNATAEEFMARSAS